MQVMLTANPIRVLIVDDHAAVRAGIHGMLESEPGMEPVGEAGSARAALDLAADTPADVILVDYHLPDWDGLALSLRLQSWLRAPRVVIYSAFADDTLAVLAVVAGAGAIVDKAEPPERLCDAVRAVAAGKTLLPAQNPGAMEGIAERVDPEDMPIVGMLLHGTAPPDVARTLGVGESWLTARRWAMLEQLRARRRRHGRPRGQPLFGNAPF
jgi:DNA-binding NarL/FixJ family response regulator